MSLTHRCDHSTRARVSLAAASLVTFALVGSDAHAQNSFAPQNQGWAVSRPSAARRMPLARLIRNPDESDMAPKYALADQAGNVQRYVEAVPGIDLEPYVGYAAKVRHDTGRTLLASQLELPGQESNSILEDSNFDGAPTPRTAALLRSLVEAPNAAATGTYESAFLSSGDSMVQPAQYVQAPGGPVVMQEGMPVQ